MHFKQVHLLLHVYSPSVLCLPMVLFIHYLGIIMFAAPSCMGTYLLTFLPECKVEYHLISLLSERHDPTFYPFLLYVR